MYNETVLDHFANPRNAGKMTRPDAWGETGNPTDGDRIRIYLRIQDSRLVEVRFQTFGCAAAIAASSMLTVLATGKTLAEARKITNRDVAEALGGLPSQKIDCSNIAADALQNALDQYETEALAAMEAAKPAVAACSFEMEAKAHQQAASLRPDQIQRYLRQIIMPAISGHGQQQLLESRIMVWLPSLLYGDLLLTYLAAVGCGRIVCLLADAGRGQNLLAHARDLNPDVEWRVYSLDELENEKVPVIELEGINGVIRMGPSGFLKEAGRLESVHCRDQMTENIPGFTAYLAPWQGCLMPDSEMDVTGEGAAGFTMHGQEGPNPAAAQQEELPLGLIFAAAFAGTLMVTETVKYRLQAGRLFNRPFSFDLLSMTFAEHQKSFPPADMLMPDEPEWRKKLAAARVLLIGSGGLGSPSAYVLARAGLGTIGLVDDDQVELSNLNRQILHATSRIGEPKVISGARTLKTLNPRMTIQAYQERLTAANADQLLADYDILLDGLDNLPSRYVVNQAAVKAGKPYVHAGVLGFYGQSTTILPQSGPCYECIFPPMENASGIPSCAETGVLGTVPGIMAVLQAVETVRLAAGLSPILSQKLLMVDALETEFTAVEINRIPSCALCQTIDSLAEEV